MLKIKQSRQIVQAVLGLMLASAGNSAFAQNVNVDNQHPGTSTSIAPGAWGSDDTIIVNNSDVGNIDGYGGNNDSIKVTNSTFGAINSASNGYTPANNVTVVVDQSSGSVIDGISNLHGGLGNDNITVTNSSLRIGVNTGSGTKDVLSLDNVLVGDAGNALMGVLDMGASDNTMVVKNSTIGIGGYYNRDRIIFESSGNTNSGTVDHSLVNGNANLGSGNTNFKVVNNSTISNILGGNGNNSVTVQDSTSNNITLGTGNNSITVDTATAGDITLGTGTNTIIVDDSTTGKIEAGNQGLSGGNAITVQNGSTVDRLNIGNGANVIKVLSGSTITNGINSGITTASSLLNDQTVLIDNSTIGGSINVGGHKNITFEVNDSTTKDIYLGTGGSSGPSKINFVIDGSTVDGGLINIATVGGEINGMIKNNSVITGVVQGSSVNDNIEVWDSELQDDVLLGLGDDDFSINNSTYTNIYGGKGDDGISVNNSVGSGIVNGGEGDDSISFTSSTGTVTGRDLGSTVKEDDSFIGYNSNIDIHHMDGSIALYNSTARLQDEEYGEINIDPLSTAKIVQGSVTFTDASQVHGSLDMQDGLYGITTFKNGYSGSGKILMDAAVYQTGSPSDQIVIIDKSSTKRYDLGSTTLVINDTDPTNATDTTVGAGQGIGPLITASTPNYSGTDFWSGSEFQLQNGQIIKQSYVYRLYDYQEGLDHNWYLQSGDANPPNPPGPPGPAPLKEISPHVPWYPVGLTGMNMLSRTALGNVHQRIGEIRQAADIETLEQRGLQFWAQNYNKVGSLSVSEGTDFDYGIHGFQGGFDKAKVNGSSIFLYGGFIGKGSAEEDKKGINISTKQDLTYGGLYFTWAQDTTLVQNPAYLDIIGLYGDGNYKLDYRFGDTGQVYEKYKGSAYAFSIEAGKTFNRGKIGIEPQLQLVYSSANHGDFIGSTGSDISRTSGDSITGRVGIRIIKNTDRDSERKFSPYLRFNLLKQLSGNSDVNVDGASYVNKADKLTYQAGIGATYTLSNKVSLYGEFDYNWGGDKGWEGRIGGRYQW